MMRPERPRAVVTGGALRVGRAACLALARAGLDVTLTYRSSSDQAERLASEIRSTGADCALLRADLGDSKEVAAVGKRLADLPRVDVLVHNASVYGPSPLADLSADAALDQYRVNALAPLLLTAALADRLAASPMPGGGAVVAMCDMHALGRPRKGFAAYSMSKAALIEMVRCLARDLAPRVRVNGVAPGVVAFPESGYESTPDLQAKYLSRVPLDRSGTPEDAAEAVRWLALDARYTTGEIVRVDGGRWLA